MRVVGVVVTCFYSREAMVVVRMRPSMRHRWEMILGMMPRLVGMGPPVRERRAGRGESDEQADQQRDERSDTGTWHTLENVPGGPTSGRQRFASQRGAASWAATAGVIDLARHAGLVRHVKAPFAVAREASGGGVRRPRGPVRSVADMRGHPVQAGRPPARPRRRRDGGEGVRPLRHALRRRGPLRRMAALQDQESGPTGAVVGTGPQGPETAQARKPQGPRALSNSRGGTRTLDPGIMSAVL